MSFFDTLTRDGKYTLMSAIRGPDVMSLVGMYAIKATLTARTRAIAFDLMGKETYGPNIPEAEMGLPGDECREVLTDGGYDSLVLAVNRLDGAGGRHYLSHVYDPFVRISEFLDHPIWGGHGIKIRDLLATRVAAPWKTPNGLDAQASLVRVREDRDEGRTQVNDLLVRIKGLETQANLMTHEQKHAADLVKAVKAAVRS